MLCTLTAGLEKIFSSNPSIGFLTHARKFGDALAAGQVLAPAKSLSQMTQIVINEYVDATLAAIFVAVVLSMVFYGFIHIRRALATPKPTTAEIEFVADAVGARNA